MTARTLAILAVSAALVCSKPTEASVTFHPIDDAAATPPAEILEQQAAIAIGADGRPSVAFIAINSITGRAEVKFLKCIDAECRDGTRNLIVVNTGVIPELALAIPPDGRPIIAATGPDFTRIIRCGNPHCSEQNEIRTVPGARDAALAVAPNGLPVLAWSDLHGLHVTRCLDASCATSADAYIDVRAESRPSIAIGADGLPVLAVVNNPFGLQYVKCTSPGCSSPPRFDAFRTIDSEPRGDVDTKLAVAPDGLPTIAYAVAGGLRTASPYLRLARCTDAQCSTTPTIIAVAELNTSTFSLAFEPATALLRVAYDAAPGELPAGLAMVRCGTQTCAQRSRVVTIDPDSPPIITQALAIPEDGHPVFAYQRASSGDSWVARCGEPACGGQRSSVAIGQAGKPVAVIPSGDSVTFVDTASLAIVAIVSVGPAARAVAFSPDGRTAYVTHGFPDAITYIDIGSRTVTRVLTHILGTLNGIATSIDGKRLFITAYTHVLTVDVDTGTLLAQVLIYNPHAIVAGARGDIAFVGTASGSAHFVDAKSGALAASLRLAETVNSVALSPDGRTGYVSQLASYYPLDSFIEFFDIQTRVSTGTLKMPEVVYTIAPRPNGRTAYVSSASGIFELDVIQRRIVDVAAVSTTNAMIAISPDDDVLFAAKEWTGELIAISTATNEVIGSRLMHRGLPRSPAFVSPPMQAQPRAVEYFHAGIGHYFVTAQADEQAALDGGVFAGWARTGESFAVYPTGSGLADVCRFFTVAFAPKGSHFYTPYDSECAHVKQNPDWIYEKIAFQVRLPQGGGCPAATTPLYRLFNGGQTGAPNHRYTTDPAVRSQLIGAGFIPEDGNTACVPSD